MLLPVLDWTWLKKQQYLLPNNPANLSGLNYELEIVVFNQGVCIAGKILVDVVNRGITTQLQLLLGEFLIKLLVL